MTVAARNMSWIRVDLSRTGPNRGKAQYRRHDDATGYQGRQDIPHRAYQWVDGSRTAYLSTTMNWVIP